MSQFHVRLKYIGLTGGLFSAMDENIYIVTTSVLTTTNELDHR